MAPMAKFFDPTLRDSDLFAMGGLGHLALVLIMFVLLALMIGLRGRLGPLRRSNAFMMGSAAFILSIEVFSYALTWIYPVRHFSDHVPLHLCATMKLTVSTLILLKRYDLVRAISIWSIGAGFISFANLSLDGESFGNFMFWHYLAGHYYLFLMPIFLFLTGDFRYDLRFHAWSLAGLIAWSLVIFFVNWGFDSNFMYSGPHNQTQVPFIPARFMIWPMNYFSYVGVGVILLSVIYVFLKLGQERLERDAVPSGSGR